MQKQAATAHQFKDLYTLQMRLKMVANLQKKSKECVLVIIEKDERCTKFTNLNSSMFLIGKDKTRISIQTQLRKKLSEVMNRSLEKESIFMYTTNTILNRDDRFDYIYEKYRDKEDGILYLKYSSVEPF